MSKLVSKLQCEDFNSIFDRGFIALKQDTLESETSTSVEGSFPIVLHLQAMSKAEKQTSPMKLLLGVAGIYGAFM